VSPERASPNNSHQLLRELQEHFTFRNDLSPSSYKLSFEAQFLEFFSFFAPCHNLFFSLIFFPSPSASVWMKEESSWFRGKPMKTVAKSREN